MYSKDSVKVLELGGAPGKSPVPLLIVTLNVMLLKSQRKAFKSPPDWSRMSNLNFLTKLN